MTDSPLFEAFGWLGSGLIVLSLMQSRVLRFRILNLAGALISTIYNAMIGVWPFATMNAIISVIDIYWLNILLRERHSPQAYQVLEVGIGDAYLLHVLRRHEDEIQSRHPGVRLAEVVPGLRASSTPGDGPGAPAGDDRSAYLVLKGDETVGVVLISDVGSGIARVDLDYVSERFRDFTPGEFVYERSGVFTERGFQKVVVDDAVAEGAYYSRVGFAHVSGRWEREIEQVPGAG